MTNAAHIPSAPTVLAIGAHPDDIELGCGATLLRHRAQGHHVSLLVMTSGTHGPRLARSRMDEQQDAADLLGAEVYWGGFQDGAIPEGRAAIEVIERVMEATGATVMYTHSPNDSHQDHRATAAASAAAGRRVKTILRYEAPSTTAFAPSVFVDVDGYVEGKLDLIRAHLSQVIKNRLVDLEAIEAMARYRGFSSRGRNAEAFEVERLTWDLGPAFNEPAQIEALASVRTMPAD
jgi:LmbE family N-acetylglucosaminyl deacetylase